MSSLRKGLFKSAIARREDLLFGTWIKLPAAESVELVALAGFDFVVIDLEHSPISLQTAFQLIGTARLSGVSPLVRIPGLDAGFMQRVLDAGADGILLPHVDSAEQARAAVSVARFPPVGTRGVGATSRAGGWGLLGRDEYLRFGQEEVALIAQIESAEAVKAAREIATVDGLDALFIGAADLSVSVGKTEADPEVTEMISSVIEVAKETRVPIGNSGDGSTAAIRRAVDTGYNFTMLSNDASLLGMAAKSAIEAGRSMASRALPGDRRT
jgi:4-hydroxy-2-oxoheptanedioate aldolase